MSRRMRSPIYWFGGKGRMTAKLIRLLPPHHRYVEVFGGGASLLFAKEPAPVEVYNDLDSGLVNFFRVLRDPEGFERLQRLAALTPYSREEYYYCRETWEDCEDDVERAYRWFVVARMSFSGQFGCSWSYTTTASNRGMTAACSRWLSAIEGLPQAHARLMRVQVEHADFRRVLAAYDTPETLFYLDPPYIPATRRGAQYRHDLTDEDHRDLVTMLLEIEGRAILSGYAHDIYRPLEDAGWRRVDWSVTCDAAGRTRATRVLGARAAARMQPRTESVWLSPNIEQQMELGA